MNYEEEEVLAGGNVNHVVRTNGTVRRPTGYWSPAVHALLKHLDKQGFEGAPRFLGTDESGREILSFVEGDVSGNRYPEMEPYMWSDESLIGVARLLRQYHDAAQGFVPGAGLLWQMSLFDASDHEVICHNDAALYNVVFQNGSPAAWIDFDMAGPGPRIWDLAYSAYTCVPLAGFAPDYALGSTDAYQPDKHAADRRRRLQLFFHAYGLPVPHDLAGWILRRLTVLCETLQNGAAEGNSAYQKMIDEGHLAHYEDEIQFIRDHFDAWV